MKPPPPPNSRPRPRRQTATDTDITSENREEDRSKSVAIPVIVAGVAMLCLLFLLCAGGIGAGLAYKAFSGGGGGEDGESEGMNSNPFGALESSAGDSDQEQEAASEGADAGNAEQEPPKESEGNEQQASTDGEEATEENSSSQPDSSSGSESGDAGGGGVNIPGATFFGITSTGERVIYVVDCSGSMDGAPFNKAKDEILRSIRSLLVSQKYLVIFFDEDEYPMFWPTGSNSLIDGSDANLKKAEQWVRNFQVGGGTDPTKAMQRAISFRPETIFLLTDGEFDSAIPNIIRTQNAGKSKINTISFISRAGEPALKQIAEQNGGVYRHAP